MIPDQKQCIKILEENNVPTNVIEHSKTVTKVAVFLAKELKKTGEKINVALLEAAAMLHDLDKIKTLDNGHQHGEVSFEILSNDYKEVAELIKKHRFHCVLDNQLQTWEEKIINYSDARCQEDEIVSLDERIGYIMNRYPDACFGRKEEAEKKIKLLEKELLQKINLKPNKLAKAIEEQILQQKKLRALKRKQKQHQGEPTSEIEAEKGEHVLAQKNLIN